MSQHSCSQMSREDAGYLPRSKDEDHQGSGILECVAPPLHSRVVVASAVLEA